MHAYRSELQQSPKASPSCGLFELTAVTELHDAHPCDPNLVNCHFAGIAIDDCYVKSV